MNPDDVMIPPSTLDGTESEIMGTIALIKAVLLQVYPHLSDLAEAYKAIPDENVEEKQAALDKLNALDAKRIELDDLLYAHNRKLMELNGG